MKIKYILKGLIATLLLSLVITSCETYNEPLLDGIGNTREFSVIGLTSVIRNQTTVELNWTTKATVDHYVVEFSADDPSFATIFKSVTVTAAQLPVQVQLEGETAYSIRVKAVTTGLDDSKWTITTASTLTEQIFLPVIPGDIQATQATLRWVPNSSVTNIFINPGSISHLVTAAEKASGVATITGLTGETAYTAILYNASKKRGVQTFTTGIDIGTGILVGPTDDLLTMINTAAPGAVLVLQPGDYAAANQTGQITLNKAITIRGLRSYDKPKLHVNFLVGTGAGDISLIDLDLKGDIFNAATSASGVSLIKYNDNAVTYGSLLISGCNVHDYGVSLVNAAITAGTLKVPSIVLDNSIFTNILTSGGEFIDSRGSSIAKLTFTKSTFNNCATARYFIRLDNTGLSGTGLTTAILIDGCTITNPKMLAATTNSILYVRFVTSTIILKNTLFASTPAPYTREAATPSPTFSNNNYFASPNLNGNPLPLANNRPDATGSALDPQFVNAATGDFTIQNQTLKDNKVGDPRWIK